MADTEEVGGAEGVEVGVGGPEEEEAGEDVEIDVGGVDEEEAEVEMVDIEGDGEGATSALQPSTTASKGREAYEGGEGENEGVEGEEGEHDEEGGEAEGEGEDNGQGAEGEQIDEEIEQMSIEELEREVVKVKRQIARLETELENEDDSGTTISLFLSAFIRSAGTILLFYVIFLFIFSYSFNIVFFPCSDAYEVELFDIPPHCVPIRCDVRYFDWDVST